MKLKKVFLEKKTKNALKIQNFANRTYKKALHIENFGSKIHYLLKAELASGWDIFGIPNPRGPLISGISDFIPGIRDF